MARQLQWFEGARSITLTPQNLTTVASLTIPDGGTIQRFIGNFSVWARDSESNLEVNWPFFLSTGVYLTAGSYGFRQLYEVDSPCGMIYSISRSTVEARTYQSAAWWSGPPGNYIDQPCSYGGPGTSGLILKAQYGWGNVQIPTGAPRPTFSGYGWFKALVLMP